MMTEHTPPPWKIDGDTIYDQDDNSICVFLDEWEVCRNDEANARHIVRCVNSHDALVKALEECAQDLAEEIEARYPKEERKYPSQSRRYTSDMQTVMRARAAIAAAKEE